MSIEYNNLKLFRKQNGLTQESRTMMRRSWRYSPGATNCHSW